MFFDARAYLEKLNSETEPPTTIATLPPENQQFVANVANVAAAHVSETETPPSAKAPDEPHGYPYGRSVAGTPRTWAGKVVSLDEWRRATDWERHGSTGKVWNGLTRQWEVTP